MLRRLFRRLEGAPSATVDPAERVYAVGDVHGRDDLLAAMLDRIRQDSAARRDDRVPRVVLLGDYIDRGDHSREVLARLLDFSASDPLRVDCLAGNHEVALLGFLGDPERGRAWLDWGGLQTVASYGLTPPAQSATAEELRVLRDRLAEAMAPHLPFLRGLERHARSGQVVFAHAALDPDRTLEAQDDEALLWGQLPQGRESGLPGHRLVHGHFDGPEVVETPTRICVDTGAYYTGRLTAVRLDAGLAYLQVNS